MMHLARKQGMHVVTAGGEADAWLRLPEPDAASYFGEVFAQRVALFDFTLKALRLQFRRYEALRRLLAVGVPNSFRGDGCNPDHKYSKCEGKQPFHQRLSKS